MHFYTHLKEESAGVTGLGIFADGHVGQLLELLEELGVDENTIVLYTADNDPHYNEWPAKIKGGKIVNDITSALDWVPTLVAAAGDTEIKENLKAGTKLDGKEFKVYLDGYNLLPNLSDTNKEWPRKEFFYWNDGGGLVALRYNKWKLVFQEQRASKFMVWSEPFVALRVPKLFNLRTDPFERADTDSNNYNRWWIKRVFAVVPAQTYVGEYIVSFKEFPPRQKPSKFNVDDALSAMKSVGNAGNSMASKLV